MHGRNTISSPSLFENIKRRYPFATGSILTRLNPKAEKITSHFENEQYKYNGYVIAEITHHNEFPILNIYTKDSVLAAQAKAELMGKYVVSFYIDYLQFLALSLANNPGPIFANHLKIINAEASRRQLNFDDVIEMHYLYKKVNELIAEDNQQHAYFMQLKILTIDFFKGFHYLCDDLKGLGLKKQPIAPGCTLAILPKHLTEDAKATFMHIVDWLSLKKFPNYEIGVFEPTGNEPEKSQYIFSINLAWTNFPNTIVNERAAFGLNEASTMLTMRKNPEPGALQEFALLRQAAIQCDSLEEYRHFLTRSKPASTHSVGYQFPEDGYGKIEYLPPSYPDKSFLQIGFVSSQSESEQLPVFFTNGCMEKGCTDFAAPAAPNTLAIEDSDARALKAAEAIINSKNPEIIMQKPSNYYSVAAIYVKFGTKNQCDLYINIAPTDSGNAIDLKTNTINYTHIDVTVLGNEFKQKVKSLHEKGKLKEITLAPTDAALIELLRNAHLVGEKYPELADNLNQFYDVVSTELRQYKLKISSSVSDTNIVMYNLVTDLNNIVKNLLDEKEINLETFKKLLEAAQLDDDENELVTTLFTGIGIATISNIVISFASGVSPLDFAKTLVFGMLEDFVQTPARNLAISAVIGALAAKPIADKFFKKTAFTFFADNICSNIEDIQIDNKKQLRH